MEQEKVSVIIPCFNQAAYLSKALESIAHQSYVNWECIIINDGSTDNTEDVAKNWVKKDDRYFYFTQRNNGVSSARNIGISKAKGTYVLPLDADDYVEYNYIECLVKGFTEGNYIKVTYGSVKMFGTSQKDYSLEQYRFEALKLANMIHVSGMFRKSDFNKIDGYDENMVYGYEDWEFWINLLKNGGQAKLITDTILYYRQKEVSRMTKISLQKRYKMIAYIYHKHTHMYEDYLNNWSKPINLNLAYGFYLGAKLYMHSNLDEVKSFFEYHKNKRLQNLSFVERKKILINWHFKGKINTSLMDVILG